MVNYGSIPFFGGRTEKADRISLLSEKAPCDLGISESKKNRMRKYKFICF